MKAWIRRLLLSIAVSCVGAAACGGSNGTHTGSGGHGAGGSSTATGTAGGSTTGTTSSTGTGAGGGDAGPSGATVWKPLRIGAGGFITGLDIAVDSTRVVRTDTYGAYLWSGTAWAQLVTATSMPAVDVAPGNNAGVYEIRIAPSNTMRFYMAYNGAVLRSDDRGTHWTQTAFAPVTMNANDNYRTNGQKMAVDPANQDVVYVGTPGNGLWLTTDGGTSWAQAAGITAGTQAGYPGIAFDPGSGTAGGRTKIVYVPSWGNGVWRSTDAGMSWTQTTGGPTTVNHGVVASDGSYYAVDGTSAWKLAGGTWTKLNSDRGWHSIAIDPTNAARIVVGDGGGDMNQSLDHGATWLGDYGSSTPAPGITRVATDIPWLAWTNESYLSNGDMAFDPGSHELFFAEGIGVWQTTFPQGYAGFAWKSQSIGIEQLVANVVVAPPGGKPVVASWDRALFYSANPDTFPSTHGVSNAHAIVAGWDVDYAAGDPTFLAAVVDWQGVEQSAYSTDGGQSWTPFAHDPAWASAPYGGCLAVGSSTSIVWVPAGGEAPYATKDGGQSWQPITLPGVAGWGGLDDNYYLNRHIVAADRVTAGTFYLYDSAHGLYTSTDGGGTWTLTFTGEIAPFSVYNAKLRSVPGKAGHLFFTSGPMSTPSPSGAFMHSTDGGMTWTAIPSVLEVYAFGLGATAAGATYPTIFIVGWVGGVYGVFRSTDEGQSWKAIGTWPLGSLDAITTVEGDKDVFGTVYVGFSGSGYAYGTLD